MTKTISEIYQEYKIMPSLQEHMLRVAAVASLICDNFDEPFPKKEIITACLLHDMGNIIKSDLVTFPEFLEPEGLDYWQKVKNEYVERYDPDEHVAVIIIAKKIGVSELVLNLINSIGFRKIINNVSSGTDFMTKISAYSDMRVGPYGAISLPDRLTDLAKRYASKSLLDSEEIKEIHKSFYEMEKQIFTKCKIKPEDINDETIKPFISSLRNFVII